MQRKRLHLAILFFALSATLAFTGSVFAYSMSTPYTWAPGVPNYNPAATIHTGTIDTTGMTFADFLGRSASQPNALGYGDSGVSVNWDDSWVSGVGNPNTNGDALDGLWAQIYSDGGWWDLGTATDTIAVFLSQDHGPYLAEGLEYRIFGANILWDDTSLGAQAVLTDVYLDGWRAHNPAEDSNGNGWQSDDIGAILNLDAEYRYIKLIAWTDIPDLNEPEVDAIGVLPSVPEPATMLLIGTGLVGLVGLRRKFRK